MLKNEIKNIISPKGEIGGIAFFTNYIILLLASMICNFLGFFITNSNYVKVPFFIFIIICLIILTLAIFVFIIFNYKRRFLNITKNLPLSIVLAIICGIGFELLLIFAVLSPFLLKVVIQLIIATIPSKGSDYKEYWATYFSRWKKVFKKPLTYIIIFTVIALYFLIAQLFILKSQNIENQQDVQTEIIKPVF